MHGRRGSSGEGGDGAACAARAGCAHRPPTAADQSGHRCAVEAPTLPGEQHACWMGCLCLLISQDMGCMGLQAQDAVIGSSPQVHDGPCHREGQPAGGQLRNNGIMSSCA